jgi:hypothetical protein
LCGDKTVILGTINVLIIRKNNIKHDQNMSLSTLVGEAHLADGEFSLAEQTLDRGSLRCAEQELKSSNLL